MKQVQSVLPDHIYSLGSGRVPLSKGMMCATPCCQTQLTPVMCPLGSAVRVLDTALRSWRSAALLVWELTPPSLHLHLSTPPSQPAPTPHNKREQDIRPLLWLWPLRSARSLTPVSQVDRSRSCVPLISSSAGSSAPCPSAPRRAGPVAFPAESSSLPGSWMNYWTVWNKCEKKAEDLRPRSVQGRQHSARVVQDNGGDVPVSSYCFVTDAM